VTRVFVAGGAGYIGSVVSELLLESGYEVLVFDNLSNGHREAVPEQATFIQGELLNSAEVERRIFSCSL
jgi:UDP-glucose 4-epimerase